MSTETQQASSVTEFKKREDTVTDKERGKNLRLTVGGYGLRLRKLKIDSFKAGRITIYDPRALNRPISDAEAQGLSGPEGAEAFAMALQPEDAADAEGAGIGGLSMTDVEITGISVETASLQHPPEPEENTAESG